MEQNPIQLDPSIQESLEKLEQTGAVKPLPAIPKRRVLTQTQKSILATISIGLIIVAVLNLLRPEPSRLTPEEMEYIKNKAAGVEVPAEPFR